MNLKQAKAIIKGMDYTQKRNEIHNLRAGAIVRRVKEIHLTPQDIIDKFYEQNARCYWSGLKLVPAYNETKHHPFAISPDRLNNDGDYTYDNVVLVRRIFNLGRMSFYHDEYGKVIDLLREEFKFSDPVEHTAIKRPLIQDIISLETFARYDEDTL